MLLEIRYPTIVGCCLGGVSQGESSLSSSPRHLHLPPGLLKNFQNMITMIIVTTTAAATTTIPMMTYWLPVAVKAEDVVQLA